MLKCLHCCYVYLWSNINLVDVTLNVYQKCYQSCDAWVFRKWAWSGSREQFLHCGLRKFWHSKSSVYSWYPQHICGGFVHYTYKTVEVTRTRHSWVNMLNMHSPLQLSNFITLISSGLVVQVVSALLHSNWQDFNWHDSCRGPLALISINTNFLQPRPEIRYELSV